MKSKIVASLVLSACICITGYAQSHSPAGSESHSGYVFSPVTTINTTSVKNQARTGTCWSFATTSFLETELMRMGHDSLNLSEMFNVRVTYPQKAMNYVRKQGSARFSDGSVGQDVLRAVRLFGLVPEDAYPGKIKGQAQYDHSELQTVLQGYLDSVVKSSTGVVSPVWPAAFDGILDAYLGPVPAQFVFKGKSYTPASFAQAIGIHPDDYIELTSFTHHPFDSRFSIEIPDNWAGNISYNVPLDDLMGAIDYALEHGFSVAWDGDVSERTFCHDKGVAVWPQQEWKDLSSEERTSACSIPQAEMQVTQDVRQRYFDEQTTTDDHLMHLTGIYTDQTGRRYYRTKNSWGTGNGEYGGYLYMSVPYVQAKTVSVIVHKDALPEKLKSRLK